MKRKRILESKHESPDKSLSDTALRWRFSKRDCVLIIPQDCFAQLQSWARKASPHETGGTLVGTLSPDRRIATVVEVLHASHAARRSFFTFFRPADKDDDSLLKLLKKRPELTYLGEWHTHPNAAPTPSQRDRVSIREIADSPNTATLTPVMLILGNRFAAIDAASFLAGPSNYFEKGTPSESIASQATPLD